MKKRWLIIACVLLQACEKDERLQVTGEQSSLDKNSISSTGSWQQKADVGGIPRFGAVSFSIGDKGYIGTGSSEVGNLQDFWEYDPATETWTRKADLPVALSASFGFSIGNKGYVGAGQSSGGELVRDFWEYDPGTNTWTKKANYPGSGLWGASGFSIGEYGYAGTGNTGLFSGETPDGNPQKDFWRYNPANNTWTRIADFGGVARAFAVAFCIGKNGYLGTGITGLYFNFTKDFWEYDPKSNIWIQKADFGGGLRGWAAGFSIHHKGYIGTGKTVPVSSNDIGERNDFWEFNPGANKWKQVAAFEGGNRAYATGFSIKNKGYLGTGVFEFDVSLKDFWEFK